MNEEKILAIVAGGREERRAMTTLFQSEGFPVESYAGIAEFGKRSDANTLGCVVVDLDQSSGPELLAFANEWSRMLPVIVIASDADRLPQDPLLPSLAKDVGETRLLYLVYGAMSEPGVQGILCGSPLWLRRA
jgi:hypothetical protein